MHTFKKESLIYFKNELNMTKTLSNSWNYFCPNITCLYLEIENNRPNVHLINAPCTCTKISLQIFILDKSEAQYFITILFSSRLEVNQYYK